MLDQDILIAEVRQTNKLLERVANTLIDIETELQDTRWLTTRAAVHRGQGVENIDKIAQSCLDELKKIFEVNDEYKEGQALAIIMTHLLRVIASPLPPNGS